MTSRQMIDRKEGRRDSDAVWWAGVLIWAGLIFVAENLGVLPAVGQASAWSWIFLGAGLYGLLLTAVRQVLPDLAPPTTWDFVWSIIFILIGVGGFARIGGELVFPLIVILIGIAILGTTLMRRGA